MPAITVRTAAKLSGRNRSTLTRMIDRGQLSATRDDGGRYLIDPAELERVFGTLAHPDARTDAATDATHDDARDHRALARELEMAHELLALERATHERERRTWEEERTFLRGLAEKHTDQIKLLTDERSEAQKKRRARWWPWRRS